MKSISLAEIVKLEISERIQLVEDIWDSVAAVPDSVELSDAQREELDRRLAAYRQNPDSGSPWSEVRKRISRIE
ncbi:MAG: addiction module protein [Acidobacteria bacterium]|nr:addiction module protein [Acidobacteriota bacterium]